MDEEKRTGLSEKNGSKTRKQRGATPINN